MRIHIILLKNKKEILSIDRLTGFAETLFVHKHESHIYSKKRRRQNGKEPSLSLCLATHI